MKSKLALFILLSFTTCRLTAQLPGDYRSSQAGDWGDATTWQVFGGSIWAAAPTPPTALTATVTIQGTGTVTITSPVDANQLIVLLGADLSVSSTLVQSDLNLAGGVISGSGSLSVPETMEWTSGSLSVNTVVAGGATVTLSTAGTKGINGTLTIQTGAIVDWDGGSLSFNNGTLNNAGTINNSFDGNLINNTGADVFINTGTFNKTGGGASSTICSTQEDNSGSYQIMAGVYTHQTAPNNLTATFENSGTIQIGSGCSFINAGTIDFHLGTSLTGSGTLGLVGTASNFNVAISTPAGMKDSVAGAFSAGTLGGLGSLTVDGAMQWAAGAIATDVMISGGATLTLNGLSTKILSATLTIGNGAVMNWDNGSVAFNNGNLDNFGTINNSFDGNLIDNGGTNVFTNEGSAVFNKTGGDGTTVCTVPEDNAGSYTILSGTYTHQTTGFSNTGTISPLLPGTTFNSAGTIDFNSGTVISGFGTLGLTGTIHNFNAALNSGFGIKDSLTNGILGGTGSFAVDGTMQWTGGSIEAPVNISNGATLTLNGLGTKSLDGNLTILGGGVMNWDDGSLAFTNGAIENNGTINNSFDGNLINNPGANVFNNGSTGVFNKTGGGASSTICTVNETNAGTYHIQSGVYNHQTPGNDPSVVFDNSGAIRIDDACTFINSGAMNFNPGTTLTGFGTLALVSGTHNFLTPVSTNLLIDSLAGGVTGGPDTLTVPYSMVWTAGTIGNPVNIAAGGMLLLKTVSTKSLNSALTIEMDGQMLWEGGSIAFNTGTLYNAGTINNSFDGNLINNPGTNAFNNDSTGTFNKTGGGGASTICTVTENNAGTYHIQSGVYNHQTPGNDPAVVFDNTGAISIDAGCSFINSGTINFNLGSTLAGNGTLGLTGVAHNLAAGLGLISPAGLKDSLTNGVLGGTGSLFVDGTMQWTGGAIQTRVDMYPASVMTLSGAGTKSLNGVLEIFSGAILNWENGSIAFNDGTLINEGTFNDDVDGSMINNPGTNLFQNTGTFRKTSTGTTTVSVPVQNQDTVKGLGTIDFSAAFTNNGFISPGLSPGILTIDGAQPFSANSTLSIELLDGSGPGTGNDQFRRDAGLTLDGTLNVSEIGLVPPGVYTILSLGAGTLSGSFATANLPPGYSISYGTTDITLTKINLPLTLLAFSGQQAGEKIELDWETAMEENTAYFEVERSNDGNVFADLVQVQAAGNSTQPRDYRYDDLQPYPKNNFYRLRMVDKDGRFAYSRIVEIGFDENGDGIQLFPNPTKGLVTVTGLTQEIGGMLQLVDPSGRTIAVSRITNSQLTLDMGNRSQGMYLLKITTAARTVVYKVFRL